MDGLAQAYHTVLDWKVESLRHALLSAASAPAVFVGTGGTLAVARLAAQMHEHVGGQPGRVVTPLELAALPPMSRSGVVLFSAGLKHPDALEAVNRLRSNRLRPALVVTFRDPDSVGTLVPADVDVIGLPPLEFREGFLATTSVLVMMAAVIRAYAGDEQLPLSLPEPAVEMPAADAERILVLTSPDLAPVAIDIETRCHELGLASVQVTDYRNFAHGRHVGLAKKAESTAVIGLVGQPFERLADATLRTLATADIGATDWRAKSIGPAAVLELVVASMQLTRHLAAAQRVNVARPGAAPFGRKLYHLGIRRLLPSPVDGPVERKLMALGAGLGTRAPRELYVDALGTWLKNLSAEAFGGMVLDYDGTVCSTVRRANLPSADVQKAILRLLEANIAVGFASGRGKSLHKDLRQWVPERHWDRLTVGLYNGGVVMQLGQPMPDLSEPSSLMKRAERRLRELPLADALDVEARSAQVTVSVKRDAYAQVGRLSALIAETMSRSPSIPVAVVASGHSVDVIPRSTTKCSIADRLSEMTSKTVMAVGDQGDIGGNDFELLAGSQWTLTVDQCSADPTRCWYLDSDGRAGPDLLVSYLDAMVIDQGHFQLNWSA